MKRGRRPLSLHPLRLRRHSRRRPCCIPRRETSGTPARYGWDRPWWMWYRASISACSQV